LDVRHDERISVVEGDALKHPSDAHLAREPRHAPGHRAQREKIETRMTGSP